MSTARDLQKQLVDVVLECEKHFGVAPSITSAISELGAARLVGMTEDADCAGGTHRTAVTKDTDFVCGEVRYQVTAGCIPKKVRCLFDRWRTICEKADRYLSMDD
jgi:hypothetical protein